MTTSLAQDLMARIEAALPGAVVVVNDPDGAHLSALVKAPQFAGKSRIAQHKMVYAALGDAFESRLHALQLVTEPLA
jgi:stress-induced morphogen